MSRRILGAFALFMAICLGGCKWGGETRTEESANDTTTTDSVVAAEPASPEEEMLEEAARNPHVDELFDDFLYTFTRARGFRNSRIHFPVTVTETDGTVRRENSREWRDDMSFMNGEYTTRFYTSEQQSDYDEDTTLVRATVEKIDLHAGTIVSYVFRRMEGKWMLTSCQHQHIEESDMADFLQFYSAFSTDSLYRHESVAENLRVSMMDPDNDDQKVDGIIQKEQFSTICPEVPNGTITNIRFGQDYAGAQTVLMQKTGQGNGLCEIFTFEKGRNGWKLVNYEN